MSSEQSISSPDRNNASLSKNRGVQEKAIVNKTNVVVGEEKEPEDPKSSMTKSQEGKKESDGK